MSDLHTVTNKAGDLFVGVDVDGTFIPIASVPAHRIKQQQDRAADLAERLKAGDPLAEEAVDASPISHKATAKPSGGKGGDS